MESAGDEFYRDPDLLYVPVGHLVRILYGSQKGSDHGLPPGILYNTSGVWDRKNAGLAEYDGSDRFIFRTL